MELNGPKAQALDPSLESAGSPPRVSLATFLGFSFEVIACIVRYGKSKSDLPPDPQIR
jgi:hypothetical protein